MVSTEDLFGCHKRMRGAGVWTISIYQAEAEHPTMYGIIPHSKELSNPNANGGKIKSSVLNFHLLREMHTCLPVPVRDECPLKLLIVFSNTYIPDNKTVFSDTADHSIFLFFHVSGESSSLTL